MQIWFTLNRQPVGEILNATLGMVRELHLIEIYNLHGFKDKQNLKCLAGHFPDQMLVQGGLVGEKTLPQLHYSQARRTFIFFRVSLVSSVEFLY